MTIARYLWQILGPLWISFLCLAAQWFVFFCTSNDSTPSSFDSAGIKLNVALAVIMVVLAAFPGTPPKTVIAAFVLVIIGLVLNMATIYYLYGGNNNFSRRLTRLDALLIAVGTLTTAGTGDLGVQSELSRQLLLIQNVADFFVATFSALVLSVKVSKLFGVSNNGRDDV